MLFDMLTREESFKLFNAQREIVLAQQRLFQAHKDFGEAHKAYAQIEGDIIESRRAKQATEPDVS